MSHKDMIYKLFYKNIGSINQIQKIDSTNNDVYLAENDESKQFILKLYNPDNAQSLRLNSVELFAYDKLNKCQYIKKILASGIDGKIPYSISEYLKGIPLADQIDTLDEGVRYDTASNIIEFLRCCHHCELKQYGDIVAGGNGKFVTWHEFIADYISRMKIRIESLYYINKDFVNSYFSILNGFFYKNISLFEISTSCLVPADLNLKNIIIDENNIAKIIDLETFIAGDIHFAIGELTGHTYGTWLCRILFELMPELTPKEILKIRFYALLSNLSVLLFILELGIPHAQNQTPWGNKLTFLQLLESHAQFIKEADKTLFSFVDLFKCPLLSNEGFGIKINPQSFDRSKPAKETIEKILPIQDKIGVTRFPEITQLDKTGIYAFQCVRPDAEIDDNTFTVFSGRGATKEECMASALGEAIERFCGESRNYKAGKIITASLKEMKNEKFVHPYEFNAPRSIELSEDELLEWVPTINFFNQQTYYVTANTIFYPYSPTYGRSLFRYFTTGLAAGNNFVEAIAHGLLEVIERDASAINLLKKAKNPVVDDTTIDCLEAVNILEKLKSANLNVIIRYITTAEIEVPVFSVICEDLEREDSLYVSGGYGVNLNKNIALINALNEAALSRVTTISGAREDIKKFERNQNVSYLEYKNKYKNWFDTSNGINYQQIKSIALSTIVDDITILCNKILKAGFDKILIANLSDEGLILPVVKVLIPGVERYSFKMTCIGYRGRKIVSSI